MPHLPRLQFQRSDVAHASLRDSHSRVRLFRLGRIVSELVYIFAVDIFGVDFWKHLQAFACYETRRAGALQQPVDRAWSSSSTPHASGRERLAILGDIWVFQGSGNSAPARHSGSAGMRPSRRGSARSPRSHRWPRASATWGKQILSARGLNRVGRHS